jgi:hypothetical protein
MAVAGRSLDRLRVCTMFRRFAPANGTLEDVSRVEGLVRERFRIRDSEIVLVSQDQGTKPGYPPHETNVIFWKNKKRYRLKIFSSVSDVMGSDLPIAWLLPALEDHGDAGCC